MNPSIYFPILRGKPGKRRAVAHLSASAKARIRPMFNIPIFNNQKRTLEESLSASAREFKGAWGIVEPAYFDFSDYEPQSLCVDGRHPCEVFFDHLRQLGLPALPVAGPISRRGPGTRYLEAVSGIARLDGRGTALRVPFDSISSRCTLRDVAEEAGELIEVDPTSIDLFIDFEAKDMLPLNIQSAMPLSYVIEEMLASVRDIPFRNVVLAGCSLPAAVDKKFNWRAYRSRRLELAVWRELSARHAPRRFGFADYGVVFAFESDPQKNVRPPARIRVATRDEYLLWRAPRKDYAKLCALIGVERFCDIWGAQEILKGRGNPEGWVAFDTNLHVELTARLVQSALSELDMYQKLSFVESADRLHIQEALPAFRL